MKKLLLIICMLSIMVITGCGSDNTFVIKEINLEMIKCPADSFMMGSPEEELGRLLDDEKLHLVTITKNFYIGKFEVTQSQYEIVMGKNPSFFKNPNNPVEMVSWEDAKAFCDKLNSKYLNILPKGYKFDLPTEAQWEYACRAGTNTALNNGKNIALLNKGEKLPLEKDICPNLDEVAWYFGNSSVKTHPVGQKKPNAWGLYDMHGNVWEWCKDMCASYPTSDVTDPLCTSGSHAVIRGGSWVNDPHSCRSAERNDSAPSKKSDKTGFRVVLVPIN